MKRIIIFIVTLILLTLIFAGVFCVLPNISKTYKLDEFNITLKIPFDYITVQEENVNTIINLYNQETEISIAAIRLKDDFWSSGDTVARMDEYLNLISSVNYDCEMKNVNIQTLEKTENKLGRIDFELKKPNGISKSTTIIANEEIGNVVIEIVASKENYDNNQDEIDNILQTLTTK